MMCSESDCHAQIGGSCCVFPIQNRLYKWEFACYPIPRKEAFRLIEEGKRLRREDYATALEDAFGGQRLLTPLCHIIAEYAV